MLDTVMEMNVSGKRETVVICCLSTEVMKVVEPVKFYEASRVHIISYPSNKEDDDTAKFYGAFLEEACERITESGRTIVMVDEADTTDYQEMVRAIIHIVDYEKAHGGSSLIYINISSGTPEYISAAMLVSIQEGDLVAFSVRSKKRSLDYDMALKVYSKDGRPVGITSEVYDPIMVTTFGSEKPPDRLVACLEIIKHQDEENTLMNFNDIIEAMKEIDSWDYVAEAKKTRTDDAQKERMFLRRNYITPMLQREWIVENHRRRNRFTITEKGRAIVDVYGKEQT